MKKFSVSLAASLAVGFSAPAMAQDEDRAGSIQVKALGTFVLPDGEINEVEVDAIGVPAGSQTTVNDNFVPTVAVEYFFSNNISIETIAGVTQHDVDGAGALAGAEVISDARIIPATITAKYHFDLGESGIKPYFGAGPAYFFTFDESAGAGVGDLGIVDADLTDELGVALQAGADIAFGDSGLGLSVDAKRYFIGTNARFFDATGTKVLRTAHTLDRWFRQSTKGASEQSGASF
ncbi:OmpW family protein [Erythrobacter sp. WH158]|uniref:OmpW family protein n=2 Tax=Erythrobacter crassostreae TaxID=2828328 RepID=A0A9X1F4J3_9SPHN|nr:OmpW family outer membrane protein [Erythrobacter crassostrea]MBV7259994.1 OmpW family protein [Erythrobacter crassostrea]